MRATFPRRSVARGLLVAGAIGTVATAVAFALAFPGDPSGFAWSAPFVGAYVAGVIAFRADPEQVAARRLLCFGTTATIWIGASVALSVGYEDYGHQWWLGPANVVVQLLGLTMGAAMIALLAVYPDGVYGRPSERRLVLAVAGLAAAVPIALLVVRSNLHPTWVFAWDAESGSSPPFPRIASPLHIRALSFLGAPMRAYLDGALVAAPVVGSGVVALRYRRLPAAERLRMRWPIYGVGAVLVAPLAMALKVLGAAPLVITDALQICGLLALPASAVVGLVKPDLFDIDRAVRRSILYAPLWIAILGAYIGIAAALGLAAAGRGVQLAIVVAIGATVLFEPARRRLVRGAARWAYGEALSGEELVRRLGGALEHTLDLEALVAGVASIARAGLAVRWVRIVVDGLEPVVHGDGPAPLERPAMSAAVIRAGEHLGEIDCGPRIRGRQRGADAELLEVLAGQLALAVHNARLATELGLRLEEIQVQAAELAASRSRIVSAQESARRQLERDLHDGAQQELVALIARLGLARSQLGRDPARLDETLRDLQAEAGQAFDNLRQLAAGIHPSVLSDHGLVEAIEIRSARLPMCVTIECDLPTREARFSDEIEGAAYFFVSETLANTLKHARATKAHVRVLRSDSELEIEVADDGVGFDRENVDGTGLRGLADRIEAVGGTVRIISAIGAGARLIARLPMADRAGV